jgi:hypothetical protein
MDKHHHTLHDKMLTIFNINESDDTLNNKKQ